MLRPRADILTPAALLVALLALAPGCQTLQALFETVDVAVGGEQSEVRFYTRESDNAGRLRALFGGDRVPGGRRIHNSDDRFVPIGFYTVSSAPSQIPLIKRYPLLGYLAFSFVLRSPRFFRGVLSNYPEAPQLPDPIESALLSMLHPGPPVRRTVEYLFEEYQAYVTFYAPYIEGSVGYLGIGYNWGGARYSLELHENERRVTNTRRRWRPYGSFALATGFKLDRFDTTGFLKESHVFFELSAELSHKHPIQNDMLNRDGTPPPTLYLNSSYVRMGWRKRLNLIEPKRPPAKEAPKAEKPAEAKKT